MAGAASNSALVVPAILISRIAKWEKRFVRVYDSGIRAEMFSVAAQSLCVIRTPVSVTCQYLPE